MLTAAILYVPANVLPVLDTQALSTRQEDTILSGIVFLWQSGSWPLAVIVFVVAAAEVAIGLALIISIYRRRKTVAADEINLMKW